MAICSLAVAAVLAYLRYENMISHNHATAGTLSVAFNHENVHSTSRLRYNQHDRVAILARVSLVLLQQAVRGQCWRFEIVSVVLC